MRLNTVQACVRGGTVNWTNPGPQGNLVSDKVVRNSNLRPETIGDAHLEYPGIFNRSCNVFRGMHVEQSVPCHALMPGAAAVIARPVLDCPQSVKAMYQVVDDEMTASSDVA